MLPHLCACFGEVRGQLLDSRVGLREFNSDVTGPKSKVQALNPKLNSNVLPVLLEVANVRHERFHGIEHVSKPHPVSGTSALDGQRASSPTDILYVDFVVMQPTCLCLPYPSTNP